MAPSQAAGEQLSMRLRRLKYRAWHRGTREMDLMLGPFADARLEQMAPADIARFEAILDQADTDLLKWLIGQEPVPADADAELLAELLEFKTTK